MTDFYTACQNRENEIIQKVRKQLGDYRIETPHQDRVYRHLVCFNPEKGQECSFEVYTAPHIVTIQGDWCKAYTLKAERDMLTEFLNDDEPNINYWAEKVQNPANLKTVEFEFVLRYLFDYLDNTEDDGMDKKTLDRCKNEIAQCLDIDNSNSGIIYQLNNWSFFYQHRDSGQLIETEPFGWLDEIDWDVWTDEWIRVCELLRWTACKITEMENPSN